jgi:hypothetical protein
VRIERRDGYVRFCNGEKVDLQEEKHSVVQKQSAALSYWIVEYACMEKPHSRENWRLENLQCTARKRRHSFKSNSVGSFDDKGIKVYRVLPKNHRNLVVWRKTSSAHAKQPTQCLQAGTRQYCIQYANKEKERKGKAAGHLLCRALTCKKKK